MSNETISSGDYMECLHNKSNKRNADNYEMLLKHSLANNDLIIENIFKWLETSELSKCAEVCIKWKFISQLIRCKRKYFSHQLLYFGVLSTQSLRVFRDKDLNIFRNSLRELIDSYNWFVSHNILNEFKVIMIFSKLNYNQTQEFLLNQYIPNQCSVLHINCRNEIIGTQLVNQKSLIDEKYIESESDFDQFSGISALFMSRTVPGIEVNIFKDTKIFDIKSIDNLKCVLVFHIWRSRYGHFSRLKTESEFIEYLENFVNNCENSIAFGGVTVERLVASEDNFSDKSNKYLDYICCLTFSGPNVRAYSYVIDFNDYNIENYLKTISNDLKLNSNTRTETIGFVFDEKAKQSSVKLRQLFNYSIKLFGCSGVSHGLNFNLNSIHNEKCFFKRGKCVLILIQLNKSFEF